MPTYQYACTNTECAERFELVQSFTDPAASECPVCGGPVRKVFSAVGVVFKGSGFYRNDSRSGAGASGSSSKESSAKESTSDSPAKEPSKAAAGSFKDGASSSSKSGESTSASTSPAKAASPAASS